MFFAIIADFNEKKTVSVQRISPFENGGGYAMLKKKREG